MLFMTYPNIIEYHNNLINIVYPVGSIYMSVNNVSPATFIGGTWEQLKDRFLLGAGSSYAAGSTGGAATHTLTAAQMPSHTHTTVSNGAHTHTRGTMEITGSTTPKNRGLWRGGTDATASGAFSFTTTTAGSTVSTAGGYKGQELVFTASKSWTGATSSNGAHTHTVNATGSGQAHNNMPPYLTVYMWKRTA